MSIHEELLRFRNILMGKNKNNKKSIDERFNEIGTEEDNIVQKNDRNKKNNKKEFEEALLSKKIDKYIEWNYNTFIKSKRTDYGEYFGPIELRNLIEKVAVWYELRYPDYEVNRMLGSYTQENLNIDEIMFEKNDAVSKIDMGSTKWSNFYNASVFFKSLPSDERYRFLKSRYTDIVFFGMRRGAHFHLTPNGFVRDAEDVESVSNGKLTSKPFKNMHIKDALKILRENEVSELNGIENAINNYENYKEDRERLLDAIMYRIIERGGDGFGPRRAFLFAKEFNRNIDIPMMYGIIMGDPGKRILINEYLKAGGRLDLECYDSYQHKVVFDKKIEKTILSEELLYSSYTNEERQLAQILVNTLSGLINNEELEKEKVKQLRIERKIEHSKNK